MKSKTIYRMTYFKVSLANFTFNTPFSISATPANMQCIATRRLPWRPKHLPIAGEWELDSLPEWLVCETAERRSVAPTRCGLLFDDLLFSAHKKRGVSRSWPLARSHTVTRAVLEELVAAGEQRTATAEYGVFVQWHVWNIGQYKMAATATRWPGFGGSCIGAFSRSSPYDALTLAAARKSRSSPF